MAITLSPEELAKLQKTGHKKSTRAYKARNVFNSADTFKVGDKIFVPKSWRDDVYDHPTLKDADNEPVQYVKVEVLVGTTIKHKDFFPGMLIKSREEYKTDEHKVAIPTGIIVETQGNAADLARTAEDTEVILDSIAAVCEGEKAVDGVSAGDGKKRYVKVEAINKINTLRFNTDKIQSTGIGTYVFSE